MALTIQENKDATVGLVVADRRIYLDKDGQAVEDGDPSARMLFCAAGQSIPRARAEAIGVSFTKAGAAETKTSKKRATRKKKGS